MDCTKSKEPKCKECNDDGFLFIYNSDTGKDEIQKCDACGVFESDEAAREAITKEPVDMIASGYEWTCRGCEELNTQPAVTETVKCKTCRLIFRVDDYNHCIG